MNHERVFSLRNPWFVTSVGGIDRDCGDCDSDRLYLAAVGQQRFQRTRLVGDDLQRGGRAVELVRRRGERRGARRRARSSCCRRRGM